MSYAKNYCYTLNNYTSRNQVEVLNDISDYHVYGFEVGENGTPHVQGYIHLKKKMRITGLIKVLQAHYILAKGNAEENRKYCTKDGDFVEIGTPPITVQDKWKLTRKLAEEGRFPEIDDAMFIRYHSAIKRIRQDHPQEYPMLDSTCGVWLYGESGVGKSRIVHDLFPKAYLKSCNKWWDGYQGEDIVLIDDVDPNHKVLGHHMKLWGDHYPFPAEHKGTTIRIRPKLVIVTSQYSINEVFDDRHTQSALARRFSQWEVRKDNCDLIGRKLLGLSINKEM